VRSAAAVFRPGHNDSVNGILIGMKISVNIPDDVVTFVDTQVSRGDFSSRSAAFSDALRQWRASRLEDSYSEAFAEIDPIWEQAIADGIAGEPSWRSD
jgi:Arc/MetJ-type ribon-helix-helix transcriptional regulator